VVRALMLLRLRTLMTGHTGVRPEVCDLYAAMLNHRVTPVVHEFGSLGCSGDLAPLAHVALVAMGEGEARVDGGPITPGAEALAAANLVPLELQEKEGLALINGTDGMLGCLALAIHDATSLLVTADAAAAMSVESLMGTDRVFQDDVQRLRPHPGQLESARRMARLLRDFPDRGLPSRTRGWSSPRCILIAVFSPGPWRGSSHSDPCDRGCRGGIGQRHR